MFENKMENWLLVLIRNYKEISEIFKAHSAVISYNPQNKLLGHIAITT